MGSEVDSGMEDHVGWVFRLCVAFTLREMGAWEAFEQEHGI